MVKRRHPIPAAPHGNEIAVQALIGAVAGHVLLSATRKVPPTEKKAVKNLLEASDMFQAWIHEGAAIAETSDQVRSPCGFW